MHSEIHHSHLPKPFDLLPSQVSDGFNRYVNYSRFLWAQPNFLNSPTHDGIYSY